MLPGTNSAGYEDTKSCDLACRFKFRKQRNPNSECFSAYCIYQTELLMQELVLKQYS